MLAVISVIMKGLVEMYTVAVCHFLWRDLEHLHVVHMDKEFKMIRSENQPNLVR